MDIKEVLKENSIGQRFEDTNKRIWEVVSQGGCSSKQSLILIEDLNKENDFIGYTIEKIFFLSDIVNLKFEKIRFPHL